MKINAETKKIAAFFLIFITLLFNWAILGFATDYSSENYRVKDPVITEGLGSSSFNFGLGQSLSQTAIGKSTSEHYQLWSGFQYFFSAAANSLTASAGDGQVSLSWTAPQTYLGVSVASYQLGVGTVSGSYTFESVGAGTSHTKTGLTNGTTYYFIIKALTSGGAFLVYSNEASAAPSGSAQQSGGGGIIPSGMLIISGWSSPNAAINLLRHGVVVGGTAAGAGGQFELVVAGIPAGTQFFGVYGVDKLGAKSATTSFTKEIQAGITAKVENFFLAPTIALSHETIKKGESITAAGFTFPDSVVSVFLDGNSTAKFRAGADGAWSYSLSTESFALGNHAFQAQSQSAGRFSTYSQTKNFTVSLLPSVPLPIGQCVRTDFNCDGRVDLTDFSIMIFFWEQTRPQNPKVDINGDGVVNLIDLSILLYDWTG